MLGNQRRLVTFNQQRYRGFMNQCWPPNQFKLLSQHFLQLWHSLAFISPMKGLYVSLCTLLSAGFVALTIKQEPLPFEIAEIQGVGSTWTIRSLEVYGTLKMPQEKLDIVKD